MWLETGMEQRFAMLRMEMEVVVPHHLLKLAGAEMTEDILRGVGQGNLEAELLVHLAHPDATLAGVPNYLLNVWRTRLAANTAELTAARAALDEVEVTDDARLDEPFYFWSAGTPISEVKTWFKEAGKKK
jgi:hypothetical protein